MVYLSTKTMKYTIMSKEVVKKEITSEEEMVKKF